MRFHPLGEGIDRDEKKAVPVGILGERSRGINTPAKERCRSLVNPTQLLQRWWRNSVLLPCHAATHTISHVFVHAWPPELLSDFAEQFVAATMSQALVDIR